MDKDTESIYDVEHSDVSILVVRVPAIWIWKGYEMPDELACLDRQFSKAVEEVLERARAVLMPAYNPRCVTL